MGKKEEIREKRRYRKIYVNQFLWKGIIFYI